MDTHIHLKFGKPDQLTWFLIGNGLYYVIAIALAFIFHKKRAFCKIACPVSLVMKLPTRIARVKKKGLPVLNASNAAGVTNIAPWISM